MRPAESQEFMLVCLQIEVCVSRKIGGWVAGRKVGGISGVWGRRAQMNVVNVKMGKVTEK